MKTVNDQERETEGIVWTIAIVFFFVWLLYTAVNRYADCSNAHCTRGRPTLIYGGECVCLEKPR